MLMLNGASSDVRGSGHRDGSDCRSESHAVCIHGTGGNNRETRSADGVACASGDCEDAFESSEPDEWHRRKRLRKHDVRLSKVI